MNEKDIGDLYRGLTDEERKAAAENLDQYLELAWEIFEGRYGTRCFGNCVKEMRAAS
jgi:hypothetical protein